ncbi:hypothetical protein KL86PLE_130311 [uncultured Pleomorphomonas sp.]|uniref:Uncharacterized protein n=1 Tax=uncultured Pleomorphomonas sp. TaxID=442121 RepID=A0A212LAT5_9HYPH|nr:hypothetical protein KL86PLE_130311 [uncultured Pleomorphomonas sp.]
MKKPARLAAAGFTISNRLEHRTEKWNPVFGESDATTKN